MKYRIKSKQDFGAGPGYWFPDADQNGGYVKSGYIVTDGLCNVIPGACWFRTIEQAFCGLEALIRVGNGLQWYDEYKRLASQMTGASARDKG